MQQRDPIVSQQDRARGVLVGLAVGDALGAPVEFDAPDAIQGRRAELFAMPGGGVFDWAPGEFTDDTQMALVLTRHLCDRRGSIHQEALAAAFARWAVDAADVGQQTRTVLSAVSQGKSWSAAVRALPPDAAGNGSLMRVAPVALAARSGQAAADLAERQSELTHPNACCVDACRVYAWLLWSVVHGGELDLAELAARAGVEAVSKSIANAAQTAAPEMSGWVLHTLTGALWAVHGAASFEQAVWRAVSLGRDADTVGAIAGALAGAKWGASGIPASLSSRLQTRHPLFLGTYPDALIELADTLIALPSVATASRPTRAASRSGAVSNRELYERILSEGTLQPGGCLSGVPSPLDSGPLSSRVRGMLLGVAIGDALGNTSESQHPPERARQHGEIRDYLPNRHTGGRSVGVPSDDTQLTFRTLEHLLEEGPGSVVPLLERFCSEPIFGQGDATRRALEQFRPGNVASLGVPSAGNGALMRIAPVLLPYLREPSAELWVDTVATTAATHADGMAIATSVAWVQLLWELLGSQTLPPRDFWLSRFSGVVEQLEAPRAAYRPRGGVWKDFEGTLSQYLKRCAAVFDADHSVLAACQHWYSGAYLLETVPSALYILARHAGEPELAMIRAVNDTWDNDTVASIVGGALGALHGPDAFPRRWVQGLLGRTRSADDGRVFELIDAAVDAFVPGATERPSI